MAKKKVLVISNACFSNTDSNGRTLSKLFCGFEREQIAQFFVYGTPDHSVCDRYYQVRDIDALRSFFTQRAKGGAVKKEMIETAIESSVIFRKKKKKTPLFMLFREFVWKFGRWHSASLKTWIDNFSPDVIFISLADNTFLCRLAIKIAKEKNIPIYVYSTENYVFKKTNYMTKRPSLFYLCFYRLLAYSYKKIEPYVKCGIFNTPILQDTYQSEYSYPCRCVFSPSDIDFIENAKVSDTPKVRYLGNLGVGRHVPLVEIANMLSELYPGTKLDVYGAMPEITEVKNAILGCENIRYCGFVSYEEVVHIIHESTLLIHAEKNDEFYSRDLKFAFSTKIADSVCSGTPLLMYASADLAETDFLIRNKCAFIAETKENLKETLKCALSDEYSRQEVLKAAKNTKELYLSQYGTLRRIIDEE